MDNQSKSKTRIVNGHLQGVSGQYICNPNGWFLGFLPDGYKNNSSDTIIWGPRSTVVLVILRDGSLQNPDGSSSAHIDPIEYLLDHGQEIIGLQQISRSDDDAYEKSAFGRIRRIIKIAEVEVSFDLHPHDYGLFLVIGQAMSEIQSFEFLLAGLLASLSKLEGQVPSDSVFEELLEKNYTRTLGSLVKHFRDKISDSETADALA